MSMPVVCNSLVFGMVFSNVILVTVLLIWNEREEQFISNVDSLPLNRSFSELASILRQF
jgi:hypothetical protein